MDHENNKNILMKGRRRFLFQLSALTACSLSSLRKSYAAPLTGLEKSRVSFVTSSDTRDAAIRSLEPFRDEIREAIGNKQVVIKANIGALREGHYCCATDVNQLRGILDFLKPIYNRKVIIAEGCSTIPEPEEVFYKKLGYMSLPDEYNVQLIDANHQPVTTKFILSEKHHPLEIDIINTYLDPTNYIISATRLKSHGAVIATLSLKNVSMGSPVARYWEIEDNENWRDKKKMHSGGSRGLSYNMFRLATYGVQPDLAVLDGVIGAEGEGPVMGDPIEHGVALASTDWVAADRLGVELMGVDYKYVKYIQWCANAGMGIDDLKKIEIIGPDYTKHIKKYRMRKNFDSQRVWVQEDFGYDQ